MTLKSAEKTNSKLKQCNIKAMQQLIVEYQNSATLNSETTTIATRTNPAATSTI